MSSETKREDIAKQIDIINYKKNKTFNVADYETHKSKLWSYLPLNITEESLQIVNEKLNKNTDILKNYLENQITLKLESGDDMNINYEFVDLYKIDSVEFGTIIKFLNSNYTKKNNYDILFNQDLIKFIATRNNLTLLLKYKNKLVGIFIGSIIKINIESEYETTCNMNLCCINKKLYNKNIFNYAINWYNSKLSEIGIKFGLINTNAYIGKPYCTLNSYNRIINPKKLHKYGYLSLDTNEVIGNYVKNLVLSEDDVAGNIRLATIDDFDNIKKLLKDVYEKYSILIQYTDDDIKDWLNNSKIVSIYLFDYIDENGESYPEDMMIIYKYDHVQTIDNSVVKIANLFLYTCNSETYTIKYQINELIFRLQNDDIDMLVIYNNLGYVNLAANVKMSINASCSVHMYTYNKEIINTSPKEIGFTPILLQ